MAYPAIQSAAKRRKRCGEGESLGGLIKELRQAQHLSRSQLLHLYHRELERIDPENEDWEIRSEAWLARVERNEVYVSTFTLELLCRALQCKENERVWLFKCAERIPFITPDGETTVAADVLTWAMVCLYHDPQVRAMIETLIRDRRVFTLEKAELFEIISAVLEIVRPVHSSPGLCASLLKHSRRYQ